MHLISVGVSPKQMTKLRKGHKVRVKKGGSCCLVVNPETYHLVSRAFKRNKGVEVNLTPEELELNAGLTPEVHSELMKEADVNLFDELPFAGEGLFRGGRIKMPSKSDIRKGLSKTGDALKSGAFAVNRALKSNPTSRAIIGTVAPELAGLVAKEGITYLTGNKDLGNVAQKGITSGAKAGLKSEGYGMYAGRGFGELKAQTLGGAKSNLYRGAVDDSMFKGKYHTMPIKPYFGIDENPLAPRSRGYGIHKRHNDINLIRGRGSVISQDSSLPPALQSQPFGVNFHMQFQLPPQYQKFNSGGDFEGRGMFA